MSWAEVGEILTLVPHRRTLVFLVVGAALVILIVASPAFILLALAYHATLATALVRDARRLPSPSAFTGSREVPDPLSLGQAQASSPNRT